MKDGNIRFFAATETHTFGASDLFGFLVNFPVFIVNGDKENCTIIE